MMRSCKKMLYLSASAALLSDQAFALDTRVLQGRQRMKKCDDCGGGSKGGGKSTDKETQLLENHFALTQQAAAAQGDEEKAKLQKQVDANWEKLKKELGDDYEQKVKAFLNNKKKQAGNTAQSSFVSV
ncbi:unnamed protein product [Amoebophrya sp. A120]|nr:unnamed protein product [Amoebophrya sp. A120]|eukprot:GSA120T00009705001.1